MRIRIRRIMVPVFFCLAVACLIEIPLSETTIFGEAVVLWDTLFRSVAAVPVLILFYREDAVFRSKPVWNLKTACITAAGGAVSALVLSGLMEVLRIPGYDAASGSLLAGERWLQIVVLFVSSPLLEELFFRGVLYQRFKELVSPAAAGIITAALFGVFHWNPAQGIYAFLMGLLLAFSMEKTQTVKAPVLFHLAANAASFLAALCL